MKLFEMFGDDEGTKRTMANPMPFISSKDEIFGKVFDAADEVESEMKANGEEPYVSRVVPMNDIICTEPTLDRENVMNPRNKEQPVMIEYKGKFFVQDGNHRVMRSYKQGDTSISAKVIAVGGNSQVYTVKYTAYKYDGNVDWDSPLGKGSTEVEGTDLEDIWGDVKHIETPSNDIVRVVDTITGTDGKVIYD